MSKRVIVCGSRYWTDKDGIKDALVAYAPTEVVVGGARGVDALVKEAAGELGIEAIEIKAKWKEYGRAAGPIRNKAMLELEPEAVLAFHDNLRKSKGTKNMVKLAKEKGLPVYLYSHYMGVERRELI